MSRKLRNIKHFADFLRTGLDLVFPPCCALCQAREGPWELSTLCRSCLDSLVRPARVALETPPGCAVFAAGNYEGPLQAQVRRAKFHADPVAVGILERVAQEAFARAVVAPVEWVTCVPADPGRTRRRGLALPRLLAKQVAKARSLAFKPDLLRRTRSAPPQTELSRAARLRNLEGVFTAALPADAPVLLVVDDVLTTGATAETVLSELSARGAKGTVFLALARAP